MVQPANERVTSKIEPVIQTTKEYRWERNIGHIFIFYYGRNDKYSTFFPYVFFLISRASFFPIRSQTMYAHESPCIRLDELVKLHVMDDAAGNYTAPLLSHQEKKKEKEE